MQSPLQTNYRDYRSQACFIELNKEATIWNEVCEQKTIEI